MEGIPLPEGLYTHITHVRTSDPAIAFQVEASGDSPHTARSGAEAAVRAKMADLRLQREDLGILARQEEAHGPDES